MKFTSTGDRNARQRHALLYGASNHEPGRLGGTLSELIRGRKIAASLQVLSSLAEGLLEACILFLIAILGLDFADTGRGSPLGLGPIRLGAVELSLVVVVLVLLRLAFALVTARITTRLEVQISKQIRLSMLWAFVDSDSEARRKVPRGSDHQAISVWPQQLGSLCGSLLSAFSNLLIMLAMLIVALVAEPAASAAMLLAVVLGGVAFLPLRRKIRRLSAGVIEAQGRLANSIHALGEIIAEAELFAVKEEIQRQVTDLIHAETTWRDSVTFRKAALSPLYTGLVFLMVAVALVTISITEVNDLEQYSPVLLIVIRSISYGQGLQRVGSTVASLRPLLERLRALEAQLHGRRTQWGLEQLRSIEHLELIDVSYIYAESGRGVRNTSLSITRGARIGLVGPSGGGKSTIAKLLLGELEPQSGRILVNGILRQDYNERDFRREVAGVPQFPHLVNLGLVENVKFFRSDITDSAVSASLKTADVDFSSDVDRASEPLELGGSSLSGGQVQRVGLARALAGDPGLLILDEPTSAVDQESQSRIIQALRNLPTETTVVVISHRPEVLELCSMLFFVKDGVISTVGTPHEILGKIAVDEEVDYGVAFGQQDT